VISASQELKDIFYKSRTVNSDTACTIEYNMNAMLDNITITTTATDENYINGITPSEGEIVRINPFKKLFPLDSIIKPFRPVNPGIKNYVLLTADNQGSNIFYDYRTLPYPSNSPRVYYAGVDNYYKYWLTPQNTGVNVTVKYIQSTATVSEAYATGSKVVYKTTTDHGFTIGKRVTISGAGTASLNLTNQIITAIPDARTFSVTNSLSQVSSSGLSKTATLVNSSGVATPTKPALANKIVVAFEKYHAIPSTCSFTITYSDNTTSILSSISVPSNGRVIIYYNGTSWSTSSPFSSSQEISYPAPKEIKSIAITTPATGAGTVIGVTEISARWVKDISADIVSFSIDKESTSNSSDLLPVGNITANSLQLNLVRYDNTNLKVLTYNRDDDWTISPTPDNVIYFTKNAEIKPYIKVYHSNGAVGSGASQHDRIQQGVFYLDSHSISEYGDVNINALDGSKQLMEALVPNLIYENSPVTSIIMSLLDSIGFTNYNINIVTNGNTVTDTSIPTLTIWWSENNKTVWDSIQELCRDIQMNAYFDENNILQFYTRDFLYSKSTVNWEFTYAANGDILPNIMSFEKEELPSANQVKIIWKTPMSSLYTQNAKDLWSSEPSFLVAGGLRDNGQSPAISSSTPAELIDFNIDLDSLDPINEIVSAFKFNGYFLVDSEVFEYDAIEYEYLPLNSSTKQKAYIGSEADWAQYRALSEVGSQNFKPSGKYRIKSRALFGTVAADHIATSGTINGWYLLSSEEWS